MIKMTIMEVPQYKLKELQEKITKREKEEAKKKEGKKQRKPAARDQDLFSGDVETFPFYSVLSPGDRWNSK